MSKDSQVDVLEIDLGEVESSRGFDDMSGLENCSDECWEHLGSTVGLSSCAQ